MSQPVFRPPGRGWALATLAITGTLAFGSACARTEDRKGGPPAIVRTFARDPYSVSLHVDRDRVATADLLRVELVAAAPEGVDVRFPESGGKAGEFGIVGRVESEPRLAGANRVERRLTLDLEPPLPGEYELPPFRVRFGETEVATDPLKLTVKSVLPPGEAPADINEIAPPVGMPGGWWWLWALPGLLLGGAVVWWWRRRRPVAMAVPLPHEIALKALRELMAADLPARGQTKTFYLRVSSILRHYIEDRFALHAPERTTEEFLRDLRDDRRLSDSQKGLLRDFLRHCDMVKFAEHQPNRDEVNQTLNACAQFIAETKPREDEPVAIGAAPGGGGN